MLLLVDVDVCVAVGVLLLVDVGVRLLVVVAELLTVGVAVVVVLAVLVGVGVCDSLIVEVGVVVILGDTLGVGDGVGLTAEQDAILAPKVFSAPLLHDWNTLMSDITINLSVEASTCAMSSGSGCN